MYKFTQSSFLMIGLILLFFVPTSAQDVPTISWQNTIGANNNEVPRAMNVLPDGSIIIGGYSNSSVNGDKTSLGRGGIDAWVGQNGSTRE